MNRMCMPAKHPRPPTSIIREKNIGASGGVEVSNPRPFGMISTCIENITARGQFLGRRVEP